MKIYYKKSQFFYILCLFFCSMTGILFANENGSTKVIEWNDNYGSISPLNLTIGYSTFNPTPYPAPQYSDEEIERIINHWAAGVYEMTNGAHRLGQIKVIKHDKIAPAEPYHVEWKVVDSDVFRSMGGAYIPYKQTGNNGGRINIGNSMKWKNNFPGFLDAENNEYKWLGYSLAHVSSPVIKCHKLAVKKCR